VPRRRKTAAPRTLILPPSPRRKASAAAADSPRRRLAEALLAARPRSPEALWQFVLAAYGLAVPRKAVCSGHSAPMDYLVQSILHPGRDLVVWASRGGAKTELGSVAAHLDSILYPGCQTRILGGSLDQSEKMYQYLADKWRGPWAGLLESDPTQRRTRLTNGSTIEVLAQSPRSVRGERVHRLKCDEVDEFSPEVWRAAQFVTQSAPGTDGRLIPAQMEVFSTMHRPAGPMAALVDRLSERGTRSADLGAETEPRHGSDSLHSVPGSEFRAPRLLKWCLWEVIERCPPDRSCSRCPLWADCGGKAREADGYFAIDDAIAQQARASREAWESEMLCQRPRADGLVFPDFDTRRHVAPVTFDASLPLYRAIDFGYANPFVCLWVQVKGRLRNADCGMRIEKQTAAPPGVNPQSAILNPQWPRPSLHSDDAVDLSNVQFRIIKEYVARQRPIAEHARQMAVQDPGPVSATFADPAGWQRTDVTGTGPCQELAAAGIRCRTPRAGILEGVELVRRLLKDPPSPPTAGASAGRGPGLVVDPSCRWLVRAMQEYHWDEPPSGRLSERPAKDGADHPIDALRYLVTGLCLERQRVGVRGW
jgi:hypothetical protein